MPPSSSQRSAVAQMMGITGASERVATSVLKKNAYKIDAALDAYYAAGGKPAATTSATEDKSLTNLNNLFEKYRGPDDEKDSISVEGTMAYLTELGVNLEDASSLIPLEVVQAPALGEITREGFVKGWQKAAADSRGPLDTIPKQKVYVAHQTGFLSSDTALFKRVYKHTFICSKERSQKALPLENGLVYWQMLFSPPGMRWASTTTNWLDLWLEFLNAKWTKSVNKDMWNQTLEFFSKTLEDETLSFWSEDGAWPSVIDDFVVWAREKKGAGAVGDTMETD